MTIPSDFPWRPGMRTTKGLRVFSTNGTYPLVVADEDQRVQPKVFALPFNATLDLTDPATLGALLGAVRVAYGPFSHTFGSRFAKPETAWEVYDNDGNCVGAGTTEAEALLAAWNARPRPT